MWVVRSVSGVARWARSPMPVRSTAWTAWPRSSSASATGRQTQAPSQKPGTRTYVVVVMGTTLDSIADRTRPVYRPASRFFHERGGGPAMTRPTARVLAMLELLQTGGQRTVGELAARLGVDERTVRRYAEHLADLGIPVQAQRGRYGGYRLSPGYKLPPLMLTDDEAVAVVLGLTAAERAGLATTAHAATASALAKVSRVLPRALGQRIDSLLSTAQFTASVRAGAPAGADTLLGLASAAQARRTVAIAYTAWDGRESQRELDVYGLVFHSGRWYVTGHDHARDDVRTFRLARLASVAQRDTSY